MFINLLNIIFLIICNYVLTFSNELKFIPNLNFHTNEIFSFRLSIFGLDVAEMKMRIDCYYNENSNLLIQAKGYNYTLPEVSSIYFISNYYLSLFSYNDLTTIYHEEIFNESMIQDYLIYSNYISNNRFIIYSKLSNKIVLETFYSNSIRSVPTLLYYFRRLNYDFYISNNLLIEVPYFYLRHIKYPVFKANYIFIKKNNKELRTIYLREIGGDNRIFQILDDDYRTPLYFQYPAFKIFGLGIINLEGKLNYFNLLNK